MPTSPPDQRRSSPVSARKTVRQPRRLFAGGLLLLSVVAGCRTVNQTVGLPTRHSVAGDQLLVRSDVKLPKDHPLIDDLSKLRGEIARTLELPMQEEQVTVYLFADQLRYAQYMQTAYPQLPPRRAYFVGTSKELAVYTFWGDRVQEDLRHEYTHGVLHATLKAVPLWLDEGLAEYFEVAEGPTGMNREYAVRLTSAVESGWRPDLGRLERLTKVEHMQKADYQEAWAWVHYLLHDGPDTRTVLLDYLQDLRTTEAPPFLKDRLQAAIPTCEDRLLQHASALPQGPLAGAPDGLPH